MREALGEAVPVIPVVALPGWYVETTREGARAKVLVMAVGGKSAAFMVDNRQPIEPRFRNLISKAVALRYPSG